jgi:endonuclease/exonuclease/phosphatase family metal-dependent hydrolase
MQKHPLLLVLVALSACATTPNPAPTATPSLAGAPRDPRRPTVAPLRVMSFNLRYDNAGDGPNAWPLRKAWVAQLIRFHDADAIGVQEALSGMLADLDTLLPEYARVGVGRSDGKMSGEFSAILYKRDRLDVLESQTFWLSPTPEVPGSKGWDAALERIATWGRFRDRATGCVYVHLNTHFDHKGEHARQESARLIRERLAIIDAAGLPLVMTGDLNSNPTSVGYRILTHDTIPGAIAPLMDAMKASREGHYGPTSSFTGFRAIRPDGNKIDYVFVSPVVEVGKHGILPDNWDNRFPSDHQPVLATVTIRCT